MQRKNKGDVLRVGLYCRVSSEDQVLHGASLLAQEEHLVAFAAANGMKVVGIYRDEGFSARKSAFSRPAMQELLADVKAGKLDQILFIKIDRWFRNLKEFYRVQDILDKNNVTWRATTEDFSTATSDGRLKINIMLSFAEAESDKTSERVRFVFLNKLQNGVCYFGGAASPYGYKPEMVDGVLRLVKDKEKEEEVNEFFRLALAYNIRKAYLMVTEIYGYNRAYKSWLRSSKNEIYTGTYKGVEGFCEPYITKEQYDQLNDKFGFLKKPRTDRVYIFSGLVRCPVCGKRMTGHYVFNHGQDYLYYRCGDAMATRSCTNRGDFSEIKLEKYLLSNVRTFLNDYVVTTEVAAAVPKRKPKSDPVKLQEQLRRLNVIYLEGSMPDEEYSKRASELKEKIADATKEHEVKLPNLEAIKGLLDTDFEVIYKTLDKEDKRRLWRSIIKEIKIQNKEITGITFKT